MIYRTEDAIERAVERKMDRLDGEYLRGGLTTEQYRQQVQYLDQWAQQQYSLMNLATHATSEHSEVQGLENSGR